MSRDPYEGFAERYDRFHGAFGEHDPAVAGFFGRLFREKGVHRLLDCACGTGRDLHLFHTLGCEVVGSDISASMLARAEANLAECGLSIPLHQVDYRELAQHIEGFIRERTPEWKKRRAGVETLTLAVMGCIVNGPGESKAANIGISLPGTGEAPKCPVYVDGKRTAMLSGGPEELASAFEKIIEEFDSQIT